MTDLNTVDLRERIAICDAFTFAERGLILDALSIDRGSFVVWSHEHGAWWGPGGSGYTKGLNRAGRYSRDDAIEICGNALMTGAHLGTISEIPVKLADLRLVFSGRHVPAVILTGEGG